MKKLLFILFALTISSTQQGMLGQEKHGWVKYYDGSSHTTDRCTAMAIDNAGNIYVTGYTINNGTDQDYSTIKYNPNGDTLWVRKYSIGSYDVANAIAVDIIGNIYVSGVCGAYILTIKYSPSGDLLWTNKFYEPNDFYSVAGIKVDNLGNTYVLGTSLFKGFLTLKYNSSGITQWVNKYYNSEAGEASSIAVDNTGNIFICGYLYFGNDDFVTIKYSSSGDTLWARRYNSGPYDHPTSLAVDNSGNVYVTGESSGTPFAYWAYVYATVKYDINGNMQWVKTYNGLGGDRDFAQAIAVDLMGNIYVTGYSSAQISGIDFATIKYNSNGDSLWVRRYNGPDNLDDYANSIVLDNLGNVYVAGSSIGKNGQSRFATIKYNNSGNIQWVQRFSGPNDSNSYPSAVKVDNSGNVFVTGSSLSNITDYDYCTIKYSNTIGIHPISTEIPNQFSLSQNYPNPFNPSSKIKFAVPSVAQTFLSVYDLLGREIATLVNEQLKPGTYEVDFDGSNLASGVYYYTLRAGDYIETKKMVLLK